MKLTRVLERREDFFLLVWNVKDYFIRLQENVPLKPI